MGFAKIAIEAQVPIIPVFTQNVREAFRTVSFFRYQINMENNERKYVNTGFACQLENCPALHSTMFFLDHS